MAGPRTLVGWVVVKYGIRKAMSVQRVLLVTGFAREIAGAPIILSRASEAAPNPALYWRDLQVYREVFAEALPGVDPPELYERMRAGRRLAKGEHAVADLVYTAPLSKVGLST